MKDLPFKEMKEYPDSINATGIITRLLDGLGYRFYWATEGLTDKEYAFRLSAEAMSIGEIVGHIWGLINWIWLSIYGEEFSRPKEDSLVRNSVLENLALLKKHFTEMSVDELKAIRIEKRPFWHLINGPMSDALTHVGQINILRRAAGNPTPLSNVFLLFITE